MKKRIPVQFVTEGSPKLPKNLEDLKDGYELVIKIVPYHKSYLLVLKKGSKKDNEPIGGYVGYWAHSPGIGSCIQEYNDGPLFNKEPGAGDNWRYICKEIDIEGSIFLDDSKWMFEYI